MAVLLQASQCLGRVIRSKNDYGVMILADQRYKRYDKRSKLPGWVMQFMPESHMDLSSSDAVHLTQTFLKEMAQPQSADSAVGKTLLRLEDLEQMSRSLPRQTSSIALETAHGMGDEFLDEGMPKRQKT